MRTRAFALLFTLSLGAELSPPASAQAAVASGSWSLSQHPGFLRADGADYRLELHAAAVHFTPALGQRCARTQQLVLSPLAIRRGASSVWSGAVPGGAQIAAGAIVLPLAAGIDQLLEPVAGGVELSYRFEHPPVGAGDLVVELDCATGLPSARRGSDGSLEFAQLGVGGVRIGAVTGVDALGRTVAGSVERVGARIELRLPASFVERAHYPLLLDPVLGTTIDVCGGSAADCEADSSAPDLAFDDAGTDVGEQDVYLVAWERHFSLFESDIVAQRLTPSGSPIGSLIALPSPDDVAQRPSVACNAARDQFLVAWQGSATPFGAWGIRAAAVDSQTGAIAASLPAGLAGSVPDVGGRPTSEVVNRYALVFRAPTGSIVASSLEVVGSALSATTSITVAPASGADVNDAPTIARASNDGSFLVAWEHRTAGQSDIQACVVDPGGSSASPAVLLAADPAVQETQPDCDADGSDAIVVFRRVPVAGGFGEIACRPAHRDSAGALTLGSSVALTTTPTKDESDPAIGCGLGESLAVWSERDTSGLVYDLAYAGLDLLTCTTCEAKVSLFAPLPAQGIERHARIATERSGGASGGKGALAVWAHKPQPSSGSLAGTIQAKRLEDLGQTLQVLSGACAPNAAATTVCPATLGQAEFQLSLGGLAPGQVAALLFDVQMLSSGGSAGIGCGGSCKLYLNPVTAFVLFPAAPVNGKVSFPLAIPQDPLLSGKQFFAQWVLSPDPGSPNCNLVNLPVSDGLAITLP